MAPKKTIKKNAPSKSKATQAKGKENAAIQAAKKKNQLKDSGLGMSYHLLNDSSTAMSRHLSIPRIPHCFDQYKDS
jgi:hypothetical protein